MIAAIARNIFISAMRNKKIISLLLLFWAIQAQSQTIKITSIDSFAGQFIKNLRTDTAEEIQVQTDKKFYTTGETIWFKAYCLNRISHKIYSHSKTLFVDLVNEQDSVISQLLLNNKEQKTDADISIPLSLASGYYWLRAYTKNILQQDRNRILVSPLYILNPIKKDSFAISRGTKQIVACPPDCNQPHIIFYPEGGAMIAGTNSLVAFRCFDDKGNPLNISGYVTDSWDSVVSTFKTTTAGLGKFSLYIWKSRKYNAHIRWGDGHEFVYPLPPIDQYASQLSVADQSGNVIKLRLSLGDSLYKKNKRTYILGMSRDSLCFAAIGTDMYEIFISKKSFPNGMATILLFDDLGKIISERNIYIQNNPVINIKTDKENYAAREKVKLDIEVADSNNYPMVSLISVAVTDDKLATKLPDEDEIALQQKLKNDIADSNDLVMLTQKNNYHDGDYNMGSRDPLLNIDNDSALLNINGIVVNKKNEPVRNRILTLFSNNRGIIFETDTTKEDGRFHFPVPSHDDSTQFTLQLTNLKGVKLDDRIILDTFNFPRFSTPDQLKKRFTVADSVVINNIKSYSFDTAHIGKGKEWLKAVTVKTTKKKPVNYDSKKRVSNFSHIITSDMIRQSGANNIRDALLSVPGLHYSHGYLVIGGPSDFTIGPHSEPTLIVNGAEIDVISGFNPMMNESSPLSFYLSRMDANIIDFVEVLTGAEAATYGTRGGNGVIIINTTTSSHGKYGSPDLVKFYPKGYVTSPTFACPDYDKKEIKKSAYPDERATIYWNGSILTDNQGKVSISFFTADPATTYTVTMMGVTAGGDRIYKKININRK